MGLILVGVILLSLIPTFVGAALIIVLVGRFTDSPRIIFGITVPAVLLLLGLSWHLATRDRYHDQARLDNISKGCGWVVHKKVKALDGIYLEQSRHFANEIGRASGLEEDDYYLGIYPALEYKSGSSIIRESLESGKKVSMVLPRRTFRYGVRESEENPDLDIKLFKYSVLDFDSGEILAEGTYYYYSAMPGKDSGPFVFLMELFGLRPEVISHCEKFDYKQYQQVLQPN